MKKIMKIDLMKIMKNINLIDRINEYYNNIKFFLV